MIDQRATVSSAQSHVHIKFPYNSSNKFVMIPPGKHMITEVLATVDDEFLRELKKSQFPSSLLRVIRLWPSDSPSQTPADQHRPVRSPVI